VYLALPSGDIDREIHGHRQIRGSQSKAGRAGLGETDTDEEMGFS
jgi:hypothetical protein